MKTEIIISGFGGQGCLSMGKILAYSGLMENKEVEINLKITFIPELLKALWIRNGE